MAVTSDVEIRLRADVARLQQDMDAARRVIGGTMANITTAVNAAAGAFKAFIAAAAIGAIVAFVHGLKEMVNGSIEAAGSINDLSIQTGASAAALLKFREIGATSDTTVESLAGAMNKLAKGMSNAADESKGVPRALEAIGLNFDEFRRLAPEQQTIAVAKAMDQFRDGAGKAAVAMALYGKEGAKMLPFLKDLADQSDDVTAALTQQEVESKKALVAMADNYGDNMTKIGIASSQTRKAFSEGILPALYETSGAFLNVITQSSGLRDTMRKLSADGTLAEWARNAVIGVTYLIDAFQIVGRLVGVVTTIVWGALKVMGTFASGAALALKQIIEGDYSKAYDTMKTASTAVSGIIKDSAAEIAAAATDDTFGKKMRTQLALMKDVKAEADAVKDEVDYTTKDPAKAAELDKQARAYRDLLAMLRGHVAESQREADGTRQLNEAEKEAIKVTEQLRSGKLVLSDAQKQVVEGELEHWRVNLASIESQKALVKMNEDMAKAEKEMGDTRAAAIKKGKDEAEQNEELARTVGKTKTQIEEMELARLREQLAQRASVGMTKDEIDVLEQLIALKERSVNAVAAGEEAKKNQEFWASIDKTAHDTFVSIADGGKDLWKRLRDSAKNTFFDWLYQMTLKKWIINISTSLSGTGGVSDIAGAMNSGGSGSGTGSLFSMGQTIYSGFENGFSSIGTSMGQYVTQLGNMFGSSSVSAFGSGMGLTGGQAGEAAAAYNSAGMSSTGSAISAGSTAGSAAGMASAFALAATIGRALGNAISQGYATNGISSKAMVNWMTLLSPVPILGGVAGGLINRAFGYKPKEFDPTMLNGTLGAGGFAGSFDTAWKQKGGWFRSDKSGVDKHAVDAATADALSSTYAAIKQATAGFASVLGLDAESIANRTQTIKIALTKDDAANQKAISEFFAGVGDTIARELLPSIDQFQAKGENAAATLARLAVDFQAVDVVLRALGTDSREAFGAVGAASIEARERLIALAGGLEAMGKQTQYFVDNFLNKAERMAPVQQQVASGLAAIGMSGVQTADQFKHAVQDLVKLGALATEQGARTYTSLMALAPAFKEVADYMDELRAAAIETANADVGRAMEALGRAVQAQKDVVTEAYTEAMDVLDARIAGLNDTISTTTALSKALAGAVSGTGGAGVSRMAAQAQIGTALAIAKASGILPSVNDLADALAILRQDGSDQFSTLADYQRDVARSNAALEELGGLTDAQVSTAERALAVAQGQKDEATAAYAAELSRLDSLVTTAQAQVDAINGVNNTAMSINAALAAVANATQTLAGYLTTQSSISFAQLTPDDARSGTISGSTAVDELRTLNDRMGRMESSAAQTADSITKLASQFDNVSAGGNSLLIQNA